MTTTAPRTVGMCSTGPPRPAAEATSVSVRGVSVAAKSTVPAKKRSIPEPDPTAW